jgi:phosphoribosyl 1,2-cyclic phosphodiesterase
MKKQTKPTIDEVIFLGTGGARYVIAKQLRATGGMFFRIHGKNILVDPGPESLCRLLTYVPKFNPEKIDAIILSHKHIDHSADINVYLDVITRGGFKKDGVLIAPKDAFGEQGVIFKYLLDFLKEIKIIKPGFEMKVDDVILEFPLKHEHRVETYGFKLLHNGHLSVPDCVEIISGIKPKVAIITHFGMTMLRAGPWNIARQLKEKTGVTVLAAEDGKHYEIKKLLSYG